MNVVPLLAVAGGFAIVAASLFDIFEAVILPRAASVRLRLSSSIVRTTWPMWSSLGLRIKDDDSRENFLGAYAPLALISFLFTWGISCIVGYGLILYGIREQLKPVPNFGEALYFAGTSFLTIGYGDIVPHGGMARVLSLAAGASGFAIVAIVTTFLFSVFGGFQSRERFVVTFGTRAGAPPSGVTLLETYAALGLAKDVDQVFEEGLNWAATVLETHLAYPILAYFRSSHDAESWVGTLGALLDASTLKITLLEDGSSGHAKLFNILGRHLVRDMSRQYRLGKDRDAGVERYEFDAARVRLQAAGWVVRDADAAWQKFAEVRSSYASPLNAMASYWRIPPAQWIGDRSLLSKRHSRT